MTTRILFVMSLMVATVGCGGAVAETVVPQPELNYEDGPSLAASNLELDLLALNIDGWDTATRADVAEAARVLQVNCPYNRAAFQLPVALSLVADKMEGKGLNERELAEWRTIQAGLSRQAQLVDAIAGRQWAEPGVADYLDRMEAGTALTRSQLESAKDPMVPMMTALMQIGPLVAGYDDATKARIDTANDLLHKHTGDTWEVKFALLGWRDGLQELAHRFEDPRERAHAQAMLTALDHFVSQRC
mgnify:CR=1 FL=1